MKNLSKSENIGGNEFFEANIVEVFCKAASIGNIKLMNILYEGGVDIDSINHNSENGNAALHDAIHDKQTEAMEFLINKKAKTGIRNKCDETPFYIAACIGNAEAIEALAKAKADINAETTQGYYDSARTPLDVAKSLENLGIRYGSRAIVELLEANGGLTVEGKILAKAKAKAKAKKVMPKKVLSKDDYSGALVRLAVREGNITELRRLSKLGADINDKNELERRPVHFAAWNNTEALKVLIENKAKLNVQDNNGITPLHNAARNNTDGLRVLIENKAKLNVQDGNGMTPLHEAATYNTEALKVLIENKAKLNVQSIVGMTPAHLAAWKNIEGLKVLIENKAKLNVQDNNGKTPLDVVYESFREEERFGKERLKEKKELKEIINSLKEAGAKTGEALREEKKQKDLSKKVGEVCGGNRANTRRRN